MGHPARATQDVELVMPGQTRPAPAADNDDVNNPAATPVPSSPPPLAPADAAAAEQQQHDAEGEAEEQKPPAPDAPPPDPDPEPASEVDRHESDGEDDCPSSTDKDGFILVKLADIRKEVQCPICLGIIRKTRTVMECLHRFCRECIDKSMRLGNNECPACRTHCASRRSLRDDPNYDNLIAALYPDIDKYEQAEMAFHEEEMNRNKEIQASIAEILRRQTEALGKRRSSARAAAAAIARRAHYRNSHGQSSYLRGRGRSGSRNASFPGSDDDEDEVDVNGNGDYRESSSAEENSPGIRPKRSRRWRAPRSSPARTTCNVDTGGEDADDVEVNRDNFRSSPLRVGTRERLAWGKGGTRSQSRHGSSSGSNGRFVRGGRITKLVEHLRNLREKDDEFEVHYTVLPVEGESIPCLERPHLRSPPNILIRQLCKFIAGETQGCQPDEVEIFIRKPEDGTKEPEPSSEVVSDPLEKLLILGSEETLAGLHASIAANQGDLVLLYRFKNA